MKVISLTLIIGAIIFTGNITRDFFVSLKADLRKENAEEVQKATEFGFYAGQMHALTNDYRICYNPKNKSWNWNNSPWDDNRPIKFDVKRFSQEYRRPLEAKMKQIQEGQKE